MLISIWCTSIFAISHLILSLSDHNSVHYTLASKDFEAEVLQVTFLPGQSNSSVCVIIIDDDIREGNEYFHLLLSIPYSVRAQGVWTGYPYYTDVKIIGTIY